MSVLLLDTMKREFKLKNDSAIANLLQVSRAEISRVRNGKRVINRSLILSIHEETGMSVERIRELSGVEKKIAEPKAITPTKKPPRNVKPTSFVHRCR